MMATYSPFLISISMPHGMDGLVTHDVGLHQVPGANDDALAPELFSAFCLVHHRGVAIAG